MSGRGGGEQSGSVLLPTILLLLLVATAATAMSLQARTSLRESSTRRDRQTLAGFSDAAVRAAAVALAEATAAGAAPPFALDGTSQACRLPDGGRLTLTVQDEGGRIDLNKATPALLQTVLGRAGVPAGEVATLVGAIMARRGEGSPAPREMPGKKDHAMRGAGAAGSGSQREFVLAEEIGDLPGVAAPLLTRLRPLFTTANRSAGLDPSVAAPTLRALLPPKEMAAPAFEPLTTPSSHTDFAITATAGLHHGPLFTRATWFRLDPSSGPFGRFLNWDAPPGSEQPVTEGTNEFCRRVVAALTGP